MNLYFLVEGRRTEAIVYPEWLKFLLPDFRRVEFLSEVSDKNYILMSGYGYPNLLYHIDNAVRDIKRSGKFSYLVICIDADDQPVKMREREVLSFIKEKNYDLENLKIRVIVQKKCIESWFLGNWNLKKEPGGAELRSFFSYYDIFSFDPEEMEKPLWYRGSVGNFHVDFLCRLFEANGRYYSKKRPFAVCAREYFSVLENRATRTYDLGTLRHFLRLCGEIRDKS